MSESIDVVVHCVRTPRAVQVQEIIAVEELATGSEGTQFTITELFSRAGPDDPLMWTGNLPARASRALADVGYDLPALFSAAAR